MKLSNRALVALSVGLLSPGLLFAAGPAAAQSCTATCNAANLKCSSAGRDDSVCLSAWHQCKVGCNSAAPAKLKVTRPSPNTVVIKTSSPAPTKH